MDTPVMSTHHTLFGSSSLRKVKKGSCVTRYPIVLLHGLGYRDDMIVSSWGRVPDYLRRGGAEVHLGDLDAWDRIDRNAERLVAKVNEINAATERQKVNIVAHSKGGLEARYAISKLGLGPKVASLTTISTPHRGSAAADCISGLIPDDSNHLFDTADFLAKLMGDKQPDSHGAIGALTRTNMEKFNEDVADFPGVYYQSYSAMMKSRLDDPLFFLPYEIVLKHEGKNDGIVSLQSGKWGEFQGVIDGKEAGIGISHLQITGSVKDVISGVNIPLFYVAVAVRLRNRGF